MSMNFPKPTSEQCSAGEILEHDGKRYLATWYPQMGGYAGMCLVELSNKTKCFDVAVWHDGEFPFETGDRPVILHHCDADQFIRFGALVAQAKGLQTQT